MHGYGLSLSLLPVNGYGVYVGTEEEEEGATMGGGSPGSRAGVAAGDGGGGTTATAARAASGATEEEGEEEAAEGMSRALGATAQVEEAEEEAAEEAAGRSPRAAVSWSCSPVVLVSRAWPSRGWSPEKLAMQHRWSVLGVRIAH